MKMFADQCSKCTRCRKGLCAWLKKYRSEYLKNKAKKLLTSEQRVALCYPEVGEPCDSQLSFDEYVSGIDGILSHTTVPVSYQGLVETLSSLSQLDARSRRFSRQLHPLLPDFLGTGIEHCLAYIDYTYLKNRLDIEQLIIVFFPEYQRMEVLGNCNHPLVMVRRLLRRATCLTIGEMEFFGELITVKTEISGKDNSSPEPVKQETAPPSDDGLSEGQKDRIRPYLIVLADNGYCRRSGKDYHWIGTKEGGYAYTQAAWIIQCLSHMFPDIRQNKLGLMLGIRNISSYTSRILEDAPYKSTIRKMFRDNGLKFE